MIEYLVVDIQQKLTKTFENTETLFHFLGSIYFHATIKPLTADFSIQQLSKSDSHPYK